MSCVNIVIYMGEKIYVFNKLTNTLHIKDFCTNGSTVDKELFETENDVIEVKEKFFSMCKACESKKRKCFTGLCEKFK